MRYCGNGSRALLIRPAMPLRPELRLDLSQEELARAITVSISTVRDFEKRRRVPDANNLIVLLEPRGFVAAIDKGQR